MHHQTKMSIIGGLRRLVGVMAAVLVVPIAMVPAFWLMYVLARAGLVESAWGRSGVLLDAMGFGVYAGAVAVTVALLVALPIVLRLERRRRPTLRDMVLVGGAAGALPFTLFFLYVGVGELQNARMIGRALGVSWAGRYLEWLVESLPHAAGWLALGVWCGVCGALAFRAAVYGAGRVGRPKDISRDAV